MNTLYADMDKRKKIGIRLLLKTIVYAFAVFGVVFILILLGVLSIISPRSGVAVIPDSAVLNINFDDNYAEVRSDDFFAEFADKSVYSVFDLVRAINTAADDDRVKAISATVNMSPLGLAQMQDVARALAYFKSKGKEAHIFSNTMGSFGQGTKEYYLATYFDEIWLQAGGDIGMTGVNIEVPFFKGVLNKIGVEPEFYTRHEYKTAVASLVNKGFTPAYKEELSKLGSGLFNQLVEGIAENRHLSTERVKNLIDKAPIFAGDALETGLIDKIGYKQEMTSFLERRYQAKSISIKDYMSTINDYEQDNIPLVAMLVLDGAIDNGTSTNTPMREAVIGSETVVAQLKELSNYKNIKALIVRINSPGGSYVASEEIWYALNRFKKWKSVPVVVSMGDYAASGGYFVAIAGDYIVAEPATVTGSVGVLGGKMVLADLWKKLDIGWGEIKYGKNSGILSANHKFSASEKAVFNRSLDNVYKDFTGKVAKARNLSDEQIDKLARGRVWLGQDAVKAGLVDEIGGFELALQKAKELAGIKQDDTFGMMYYPRRPNLQEKLSRYLESGGGLPAMQIMEKSGLLPEELDLLFRLKHDAILPPFKLTM